jgi:hypothetical protein
MTSQVDFTVLKLWLYQIGFNVGGSPDREKAIVREGNALPRNWAQNKRNPQNTLLISNVY